MLELLKNEIVINWIAPIITGLIVVAVPTIVIKTFKLKKDEKTIKQANQRFLDSIMPFIIQKIKISSSYISDIRNVVIEESGLRDKYVYSEISLRNKLTMDISESKYVDEDRKKELIDFTYDIFQGFENAENLEISEEHDSKKPNTKVLSWLFINPLGLLIVSQIMIVIVVIFDKRSIKPEENILIMLPFLLGFISVIGISVKMISKIFESNVSRKKYRDDVIYRNYLVHKLYEGMQKGMQNNKDVNSNYNNSKNIKYKNINNHK